VTVCGKPRTEGSPLPAAFMGLSRNLAYRPTGDRTLEVRLIPVWSRVETLRAGALDIAIILLKGRAATNFVLFSD
jgi:hypothetical protein